MNRKSVRGLSRAIVYAALALCLLRPGAVAAKPLVIPEQPVPLAGGVLQPASPGSVTFTGGGITLDASNAQEGYVTARYDGDAAKAKARITKDGVTYTYTIPAGGGYEVFPLTLGDGTYRIEAYYNVYGDQYALGVSQNIDARLQNPMLPFLYPSQYVNFSAASQAVAKADGLSRAAENDLAKVSGIYRYIIGNITYDTEKAQLVTQGRLAGYVPDVDSVLASQKGICFDYAALMTAMLRSQSIPTCMQIGYVTGGVYHAWICTYITDVGWVNGVIRFDGQSWTLMDPTFAASGGADSPYTGEGMGYKAVYVY